ncbi:MAG: hypothetical protein F9K40_02955 [Kofleriaceae bacterium]|nr:MAG: hypothetical protein F9K40_02955 [Kofleriaceae bacterium]MBZ0233032.1 hypothetical protein [Kofleriaceae bacterium]
MSTADLVQLKAALELCCAELAASLEEPPPVPAPVPPMETVTQAGADNLRWRPLALVPLPGLDQLISIVSPPIKVIIALLNLVKALLEALAAILVGLLDPFKALIEAAIALLADIINDLLNTGAYMYLDAPGITPTEVTLAETGIVLDPVADWTAGTKLEAPPATPDAFSRWGARFAASFDDPGDPARPVVTEGAPIQAVFIVMAAPSLDALRQLLYLIGKLLNIDQFKVAFEKYQAGNPDPRKTRAQEMKGVAPDWKSVKLVDLIPPLKALEPLPEKLRGLLTAVDNIAGLIRNLAAAIMDKAQVLGKLAEALQAILDLLAALKSSGMYILPVATKRGVAGLKQAFVTAADRPPGGYIGGVCFMASGPNLAKAAMLWELLGASTAMDLLEGEITLDEAAARAEAGVLGQAAGVLEQNWDKVSDAGEKFGTTVKAESQAFITALEHAPESFYQSLGHSREQILEALARSPAEAVALLESARENFAYDDQAIQDGIDQVKQAQRHGMRSLALGLAPKPPKSETHS